MTNDNDDDNQPKKSNVIHRDFGGKSQIGDSKKKTSTAKITAANLIKNSVINGNVKAVGVENNHYHAPAKNYPKLPPMDNRITVGHRAELHALVDDLVALQHMIEPSKTLDKLYKLAWVRAKSQAQSEGDCGVRKIEYFPDCDFEIAKHYLQLRIRILKNHESTWTENKSWRKERLEAIHARCENMQISNDQRKAYQLARFGKESLRDFTNQELQQMFVYTFGRNPSFNPAFIRNECGDFEAETSVKPDDKQSQRECVLSESLTELQANDPTIDINNLPYTQRKMREILQAKNFDLFNLAVSSFTKFWSRQKLCILNPPKTTLP